MHPVGQRRLAAEAGRECLHQPGKAGAVKTRWRPGPPSLQFVEGAVAEIERAIGGRFQVAGIAARGDVGRLRVVGGVVIAAGLAGESAWKVIALVLSRPTPGSEVKSGKCRPRMSK